MQRRFRPLIALTVFVAGSVWYFNQPGLTQLPVPGSGPGPRPSLPAVRSADRHDDRDQIVDIIAVVDRILTDDSNGSAHQRFIIRTNTGATLLIAHNIDLAPRLEGLSTGDTVRVVGEYERNERGGVIHWTHRDPQGRHAAGYIEWKGRRYQ
jgi:hypothetical protein